MTNIFHYFEMRKNFLYFFFRLGILCFLIINHFMNCIKLVRLSYKLLYLIVTNFIVVLCVTNKLIKIKLIFLKFKKKITY